jgi:hypothetical protein
MAAVFITNHRQDKKAYEAVATNGHILGLAKVKHADTLGGKDAPYFRGAIPLEAVDWLAALKPSHVFMIKMTVTTPADKDATGSTVAFEVIGTGKGENRANVFPMAEETGHENGWLDYDRAQPYEVQAPNAAFQTLYVTAISRAVEKASGRGACLAFGLNENAGGPIRIYTSMEGLSYVVMPFRTPEVMQEQIAAPLSTQVAVDRLRNTFASIKVGRYGDDNYKLAVAVQSALDDLSKKLRSDAMDEYLKSIGGNEDEKAQQ